MAPNNYQRGWYQQNGQWYWYPGYPGEQPDFSAFPGNQYNNAQPTPQWPWLNTPVRQEPPQPQTQQQIQQPVQQTAQQAPSIPGRAIKEPGDVKPNEVPMDGTICFFPLSDMTKIYVKQWGSDGNLATVIYEKVTNEPTPPAAQPTQDLSGEFSTLNQKLDSMLKTMSALDVSLGLSDKKGE